MNLNQIVKIFDLCAKHATIELKKRLKIMLNIKYFKSAVLVAICAFALTTSNLYVEKVIAQPVVAPAKQASTVVEQNAEKPLDIVKNPTSYLNKTVRMNATFDKFATLGLDYKSAMRSSEEYISFLISCISLLSLRIPSSVSSTSLLNLESNVIHS